MPWTVKEPPQAMRGLPANVRRKAVAFANDLERQGYERSDAIRTGIGRAKRWVAHERRMGRMKLGKAPRRPRRVQRGRTGMTFSRASRIGSNSGPRRGGGSHG